MDRWGGAVIGSKEAAEKICSQCLLFMKHHSLTAVLWSVITAVSDEEPETQVGEGGYEAKGGSEDDLGCDHVDSCGPHRREGLRARRAKRGNCYEALVD